MLSNLRKSGFILGVLTVVVLLIVAISIRRWTLRTSNNTSPLSATLRANSAADVWAGTYNYSEFAPPNENWVYTLNVAAGSNPHQASLSIDGFQTQQRLNVQGVERGGDLDIVFISYGAGNVLTPYHTGDLLFTLSPGSKGRYPVTWHALLPQIPADKQGAVFTK